MKKIIGTAICALALVGCAGQNQTSEDEVSQRILRENERRINSLETSLATLNEQLEQLNSRVADTRAKNGQRATVVQPQAKGVARAPAAKAPTARKINPAAAPAPLPARKPAAAAPATPVAPVDPPLQAGASGQISGSDELGLPPAEIPVPSPSGDMGNTMTAHASAVTIAPPRGAAADTAVPVPLIPHSDLSLPPEHPDLPPVGQPEATAARPAQTAPAPAPAARQPAATSQRGEEAAYNAALRAARSGKTQEGIRLFRDFLQKYPNGKYAANADFWIGECLYSQGKYQDALNQFQVVNNTFPRHHKNADALLKAGMTMSKMGDQAGAQAKYRELLASFPNSDAARRARALGAR